MRKIPLLAVLALLCAALPATTAGAAEWTFLTYDFSNWAMCAGQVDIGTGDQFCDVTTAWGDRVRAEDAGDDCVASIWCNGVQKECIAGPTWGFGAGICYSTSQDGGEYKAVCKSHQYGTFAVRCN